MLTVVLVATGCVAAGVGAGVVASRVRFNRIVSIVKTDSTEKLSENDSLADEMKRYEQVKENLMEVKKNIEKIDIPIPDKSSKLESTDSSLNKLSKFFEKHTKATVGTEAFILSILPISQTGEALASFASVAPGLVSDALADSFSAFKDGISGNFTDIGTCLAKFCEGMAGTSGESVAKAMLQHDYKNALLQPLKGGAAELLGFHDAAESFTSSVEDMGGVLSNAAEVSIDPTDFTDWDFTGHIPIITIAISSFREFNLLMDDKTNAMTSLKNIGLDAVGTGGGGLLGAKAGALAGSVFGPIGVLAGSIVGGIGGAIGGRTISNKVKQIPLKNAIEEYQSNADLMKRETNVRSRCLLDNIHNYSLQKRKEFKDNKLLYSIPVVDSGEVVFGIAYILFQSIEAHIETMRKYVNSMKKSVWYSDSKYGLIVSNYEDRISLVEKQLPPAAQIQSNPRGALDVLMSLDIPSQREDASFKDALADCICELKELNDRNNSSVLVWSYMVNGLYQNTLKDIAEYSNAEMNKFNRGVSKWKSKLSALEKKVNIEKGKLGL